MKVIDTHVHFWELENKINSWVLRQSNPDLWHDYLPGTMINRSTHDLLGVVHVEAHDSAVSTIKEVEWLQNKMQDQKIQYKHIAFADITLLYTEFKNIIDQLNLFNNVVGIRHILSFNPKFSYNPNDYDLSSHENIARNLEYLAQNNLIFDCQVYAHQIKNILPAIVKSNVTTVIDHMLLPAWHKLNDEDCKLWQETILELAKHKNIYMKLSGLDLFQSPSDFDFAVIYCLEKFPNERLIYGSNYPVSCNNDYNSWVDYLVKINYPLHKREQIFYENARKLFKFN